MSFLDLLWGYLLVFLFSAIPFIEFGVIPIAYLAGLKIIPVTIFAIIGNISTVLLMILMVNSIKQWFEKRKKEKSKESKRSKRAEKIWERYGLPGLAILGPLLVGSHITAFVSISSGGTKLKTAYWVSGSIVLWSVVFAVLFSFGFDLWNVGTGENSFIFKFFNMK